MTRPVQAYPTRVGVEDADAGGLVLAEGVVERKLPWADISRVTASLAGFGESQVIVIALTIAEPLGSSSCVLVSEVDPSFGKLAAVLPQAISGIPDREDWVKLLSRCPREIELFRALPA